jgi:uncharacterized HAD superfamily protein
MAKVLLVDMDNTLTIGTCWTPEDCLNAEPRQEVIDKVNSLINVWVIVYTARRDEMIPATIQWLRKHNVRYHAISNIKIPACVGYVDDKSIPIDKFLEAEWTVDGKLSTKTYIPGGY